MNIFRCFSLIYLAYEICGWRGATLKKNLFSLLEKKSKNRRKSSPSRIKSEEIWYLIKVENFFNSFIYSTHSLAFPALDSNVRDVWGLVIRVDFITADKWIVNEHTTAYRQSEKHKWWGEMVTFFLLNARLRARLPRCVIFRSLFKCLNNFHPLSFPFMHLHSHLSRPLSRSQLKIWMKVRN